MLILADTDRFGVDLDQFRQRILETPRDGSCASLSDIKPGKFLCRQLAGTVNRRAGFIYNDILEGFSGLFEKIRDDLFRFAGGRAVAHGKQADIVTADQF